MAGTAGDGRLSNRRFCDILTVLNFSDWYQADYTVNIGECKPELLLDSDDQLYSGHTPHGKTKYKYADGKLTASLPPFSGQMYLLEKK